MADSQKEKAWPIAPAALTNSVRLRKIIAYTFLIHFFQIMDLVQQAADYKQVKKGANEGI